MFRVATEVTEELQLKWLSCCNLSVCGVANEVLWRVAIEVFVELQPGALLSCNSSDKIIKNYMFRVSTEVIEELQLWLFCRVANEVLLRVAIEVLVELQQVRLLSCNFVWNCNRI
jgi:hypothetical protein